MPKTFTQLTADTTPTADDIIATSNDPGGTPASRKVTLANLLFAMRQWVFGQDAGSTDDYAVTLSPAPSAYVTGYHYRFKANTANTGAATVNFNSLGAKTIKKHHDQDLADGDIESGQWVDLVYDGTNMQMQSQLGNTPGGGGYAGVTTGGTGSLDFAQGTKTVDEPFIDATVTYNSGAVTFTAFKANITDTNSAVGSRLVDYQIGGSTVFAVHKINSSIWQTQVHAGTNSAPGITCISDANTGITWSEAADVLSFVNGGGVSARIRGTGIETGGAAGFININGGAAFRWESGTRLVQAANAVLRIDGNSDGTGNAGVVLGGATTSFPRLRANGPILESRLGDDSAYAGFVGKYLKSNPVTVANLPASPTEGMLVAVTDSNTATWGATISGGGSNHILAYYNGTNWTVAAI